MHGAIAMSGRKRNPNVVRDRNGKSRGEPERVAPEVVAVRRRHLIADRIDPESALDALAGFTLGRLLLRHRQDSTDPGSITQAQYDAGDIWAKIVHRHASIMGYKLRVATPSFSMVGGGINCAAEPDEESIIKVRRQFSDCFNALQTTSRDHGIRVTQVTYGVCVENWSTGQLGASDYGYLRLGLNSLSNVLR